MRRIDCSPRTDWQKRVEEAGLVWHTPDDVIYWNESAFYEFTAKEVDVLEAATNELEAMTLAAAQHIIDNKLYSRLGIPAAAVPLIESSWEAEPPSLYGRFDLAYNGAGPPKLLEYNADTPTSLVEAAVAQWYWLQDVYPKRDQFNSLHERIVALWKELTPYLPSPHVDFCALDDVEDGITITYLEDTAQQAGLETSSVPVNEIGWNGQQFVGPEDAPLGAIFKLYPWEWMYQDRYAPYIGSDSTMWIEPPWKMLLSNKGILPILWELYPRHQYLLEASFDGPGLMRSWVKKPLLGREGANITFHRFAQDVSTEGTYGDGGFIYQEAAPTSPIGGKYAMLGSWVIGHEEGNAAGGIGIRESDTPITTNTSPFVPHLFD